MYALDFTNSITSERMSRVHVQVERYEKWKTVVKLAIDCGVAVQGMSSSLAYFESFRRGKMPANLTQAQRDFFGSHTYERTDGMEGNFHTVWDPSFGSKDSITTSGYNG
jgi:6-phosphogluconate dehydrogenase